MIMKLRFAFVLLALWGALSPVSFAAQSIKIAAVVNEDAVTESDVNDRMRLAIASAGFPNTQEVWQKVLPQVLDSLIEERIMLQEAQRNEIEIDKEEIEAGFSEIAASNKLSPEQFSDLMNQQGIPKTTLLAQIKAQIAWRKVIQGVLRPKIDVSDTDVRARLELLEKNIGKTEYLVAEIYLPIDEPKKSAGEMRLARDLVQRIRDKRVPFGAVAARFSKAAGADKGGVLGWVLAGQLPEELNDVLETMSAGEVSDPIQTITGIHILKLQETRTLEERTMPGRGAILNQLGMERLDKLQRRTLRDLKDAAFIERRV